MTLRAQYAPPSTLIDLIQQVRDAFGRMANMTPIMVGKQHLKQGAGSSPRVLFIPEFGAGAGIEKPIELGHAASMVHACTVAIRAKESGDDIARFRDAYALADLVIDLIQTAGTGRIDWTSLGDGSPVDVDAYGAEVVFSFTFQRDVPHNARRWALSPADDDITGQGPQPPPGTGVANVKIIPTTEPVT